MLKSAIRLHSAYTQHNNIFWTGITVWQSPYCIHACQENRELILLVDINGNICHVQLQKFPDSCQLQDLFLFHHHIKPDPVTLHQHQWFGTCPIYKSAYRIYSRFPTGGSSPCTGTTVYCTCVWLQKKSTPRNKGYGYK